MKVECRAAYNGGLEMLTPDIECDLNDVIEAVDANRSMRVSKEKTKWGKLLVAPRSLNAQFTARFIKHGWEHQIVESYGMSNTSTFAMDFLKNKIGVEVQFGKYAFVHNDAARNTLYHRRGLIKLAIEIVPSVRLSKMMSTGVPSFRQVQDIYYENIYTTPTIIFGISA